MGWGRVRWDGVSVAGYDGNTFRLKAWRVTVCGAMHVLSCQRGDAHVHACRHGDKRVGHRITYGPGSGMCATLLELGMCDMQCSHSPASRPQAVCKAPPSGSGKGPGRDEVQRCRRPDDTLWLGSEITRDWVGWGEVRWGGTGWGEMGWGGPEWDGMR